MSTNVQEKRWSYPPSPSEEVVRSLSESLQIAPTLAMLLAQRGILNFEQARHFFRPSLQDLHSPFLMADLQKAVDRILLAIDQEEGILVYGDYDVDGTTAVSLVSDYLRRHTQNVETYIPDRYKEGYGLSEAGVRFAAENGYSVIIALDCGIKAFQQSRLARELGIDLIIGDHHRPGDTLPDAFAILDPKREDCAYPFKELSGCGVGFKLCQGIHEKMGLSFSDLTEYLDLLAVSIGADIVPVVGENRILAHFGMKQINERPRPAIGHFVKQSKRSVFTITDVVFIIAPRVNAAGRIDHGHLAVELLTTQDTLEVKRLAEIIDHHNQTRREFDQQITTEALEMIQSAGEESRRTTVVMSESWHKGVIGIVASRLIENYFRPTVVFTESNGKLAGSARSVPGFDVYAALDACSDVLEQFGGHMYAAGMTLLPERYQEFKDRFEEVVSSTISDDQLIPEVNVDLKISLSEIDHKFYRILRQFAPFGPENLQPIFSTSGVRVPNGRVRKVGSDGKHLKVTILDPDTGLTLDGIGFGLGHWEEILKEGQPFQMAYHVEENEWNGKRSLQLRLVDIKI
ncbi:MAG: single-stranded-DNA-specific exonuclease RecJ [Bacteroidota bacterium]|nr:single-stranded-DNA-specific exonuclease RecJ [Bacteroidota bacterium]MDX5505117.1 single-stranded-DNA-specific exonuclease RecJ [Bacteroidota bacterium]